MSHPPECEVVLPSGFKCTFWVDEPHGPGTAQHYGEVGGKPIYMCRACLEAAAKGKFRTQSLSELPRRNDPCPCHSGKKYKNCCRVQ